MLNINAEQNVVKLYLFLYAGHFSRSQAPAWERTCRGSPASRDGRQPEAGAWERGKMQACKKPLRSIFALRSFFSFPSPAWERTCRGGSPASRDCKKLLRSIFALRSFSRSQAPAWERTCRGGSPASRDGRQPEAGASGADAFPSRGLGTRKKAGFKPALLYLTPQARSG